MKDYNAITTERLRKLIDDTGLPRQEIADAMGCDVSAITKNYNGRRKVTTDFVVMYAQYFGVTADYLLGLSDVKSGDQDMRLISKHTGLYDEAIAELSFMQEYVYGMESDNSIQDTLNYFIAGGTFQRLITRLVDYQKAVEKQYELLTKAWEYNSENPDVSFPEGFDSLEQKMKLTLFDIQEIAKDYIKKELREKLDTIEDITGKIANAEYERMAAGQE